MSGCYKRIRECYELVQGERRALLAVASLRGVAASCLRPVPEAVWPLNQLITPSGRAARKGTEPPAFFLEQLRRIAIRQPVFRN